MALYKYGQLLTKSEDAAFDVTYSPGMTPPHAGIYRCTGCGDEVASNKDVQLPPQNKHQHPGNSPVRWQLLVYAQQK